MIINSLSPLRNAMIDSLQDGVFNVEDTRIIQRYFTRFDPAFFQHLTFSPVTCDRIVMTVYSPAGDAAGLPTGAPTPTAHKLEVLDFVYSGSIAEAGKNGSDYFDGEIADIQLYSEGSLVAAWAVDEDLGSTTTVVDSVGSNDATAVNITESMLFYNADTKWESGNLWAFGTVVPDGTTPIYSTIAGVYSGQVPTNSIFDVNFSWVNLTGRVTFLVADDLYAMPINVSADTNSHSDRFVGTSITRAVVQEARPGGGTVADSIDVSIKKILEIA